MWETHYKNGKKNGLSTWWLRSGKKRWEAYYIDDIDSYESGENKSEISWANDMKYGSMTEWYKNGKEHGVRTEWGEDGKKTFQGNFVDGNEE